MKYKVLLVIALIFAYASSCKDDDPETEPFDHAAQAVKDNEALLTYLQEHYLDENGSLHEITDENEPAIYEDENLVHQTVKKQITVDGEEISFTIYYYITEEGSNEHPTPVDMVHVAYKGELLDGTVFTQVDYGEWRELYQYLTGWQYAIPNFKTGEAIDNGDGTLSFTNPGKGIIFIPSGLAYNNAAHGDIPANSPLIFYVKVNDLKRLDHDKDTVLSMYEISFTDGKWDFSKDTDGDKVPDLLDKDDDGDTKDTIDENPDPNGDGNPNDAQDSDGDNVPDYLDSDSK